MNPEVGNRRDSEKHENRDLKSSFYELIFTTKAAENSGKIYLANISNHFHSIFNRRVRFTRNIVLDVRNHRKAAENYRENGGKIDAFGGQISDVADNENEGGLDDSHVDCVSEFFMLQNES